VCTVLRNAGPGKVSKAQSFVDYMIRPRSVLQNHGIVVVGFLDVVHSWIARKVAFRKPGGFWEGIWATFCQLATFWLWTPDGWHKQLLGSSST
jgi:hypothetical protein